MTDLIPQAPPQTTAAAAPPNPGIICPHCGFQMPGRYSVCGNCRRDVFWGGDRTNQAFKSEADAASDKQRQAARARAERAEQAKREEEARLREANRVHELKEQKKYVTYSGLVCAVAFGGSLPISLVFACLVAISKNHLDRVFPYAYGCFFTTFAFFVMWRAIKDMRWALAGIFIGPAVLAIIGLVLTVPIILFGWPASFIWWPFVVVCSLVTVIFLVELFIAASKSTENPA